MNTHHFVYKTTNLINGKYYIGKHSTDNLKDNYLGSGKLILNAISKHGRKNFNREIIKTFKTEREAFEYEEQMITETILDNPDCYNISHGGDGYCAGDKHPMWGQNHTEEWKQNVSEKLSGENNPFYNKKHSKESLDKIKSGRNNGNWKLSEEGLKKISETHKGSHRTESEKKHLSKLNSGSNHPLYGKPVSRETRIAKSKFWCKGVLVTPAGNFDNYVEATEANPEYNKKSIAHRCKVSQPDGWGFLAGLK